MTIIGNMISSITGSSGGYDWQENLNAASFRGIPFAVTSGLSTFGRQQAIHEYPFRDDVWVEDLGRSTRRIRITGFLVQDSLVYSAPDVITQRNNLIAACETMGSGLLIHPTLGELTVSIPSSGLLIKEHKDNGRVFEFSLMAIESGLKIYAITTVSETTLSVTQSYFSAVTTAAVKILATIKAEMRSVTQTVKIIKNTAKFWQNMINGVINEATNLSNLVDDTFGNKSYSRYSSGAAGGSVTAINNTSTVSNTLTPDEEDKIVDETMVQSVIDKNNVEHSLDDLVSETDIDKSIDKTQQVINAINDANLSEKDKIRLFETLCQSKYTAELSTVQLLLNLYYQVLFISAMVRSASSYTPNSYDEAMIILKRVVTLLDEVILSVADNGLDTLYGQLILLKRDFINVMVSKGANLSALMSVRNIMPVPSLYLANKLYQDSTRSLELTVSADPIHPAFMPTEFKALSE